MSMRHRIRGSLGRRPACAAVHRAPPGNRCRRDDPRHRGTGPTVGGRGQDPPTQNHPAQPGFASHLGVVSVTVLVGPIAPRWFGDASQFRMPIETTSVRSDSEPSVRATKVGDTVELTTVLVDATELANTELWRGCDAFILRDKVEYSSHEGCVRCQRGRPTASSHTAPMLTESLRARSKTVSNDSAGKARAGDRGSDRPEHAPIIIADGGAVDLSAEHDELVA